MPEVVGQDKRVTKEKTCNHCGAINEYLPNEVRVLYTGRDISGGSEGTKGFNCAGCGQEVITEAW